MLHLNHLIQKRSRYCQNVDGYKSLTLQLETVLEKVNWKLFFVLSIVRRVSDPPSGFPKFRDDYRCGASVLAPNGDPAECDPEGILPCCSPSGWCGVTSDHCDCEKCVDYRVKKSKDIAKLSCWIWPEIYIKMFLILRQKQVKWK